MSSCLTKDLIFHYYSFGNYLNLIGAQYSECNKLLKTLPFRNITFDKVKDQFIYDNCVHPEWKTNLFDFAEKQLEERIDNFHHNLKKIKEYQEFRQEKGLSFDRAEVLKGYFELRLKSIDSLKKEMRRFMKINKENRGRKIKKEEIVDREL